MEGAGQGSFFRGGPPEQQPIDPKENQVFTVEGDLWRVVVEANDCDFHLELSAPGAGIAADRVIVEVSKRLVNRRRSAAEVVVVAAGLTVQA
jgi:hypothetical protein